MTFTAAAANVGLWQYSPQTHELWATNHCRAMFGLGPDVPLTRASFLAAIHPDDREAAIAALRHASRSQAPASSDVRVVWPDLQMRWIRIVARSHQDQRHDPKQLSGTFVDISHQKAAEVEAAVQRQEVAHLMRVSVLGELSGAIAHEINQPLTAILSNAQAALYLLPENAPNVAEVREALQDIVHEDNRAGRVIQKLRSLLKKGETTYEPIELNELVNSTVALLNSELIGRGVSIQVVLSSDLPPTSGDPVQLQQVLINLIVNAIDAMADTPAARAADHRFHPRAERDGGSCGEGPRNGHRRSRAAQTVRAVLYDEAARPWTRFGNLFDDHPGAWRRAVADEQPRRRRGSALLAAGPGNADRSPMNETNFTVYVVDDDAGVLNALSRLLRAKGYTVQPFTSPHEFLAKRDAAAPGCVILDITMPGLDGLDLQQALSSEASLHPVIFLTGTGDIPTSVRAMRAGALDFLTKPVDADALFQAIARAEEQNSGARLARAELESIKAKMATLTKRESEVLVHVVAGRLNKQIAHDLGTVEKTIKVHRGRMMQKLGVHTVADLVRLAEKIGIRATEA